MRRLLRTVLLTVLVVCGLTPSAAGPVLAFEDVSPGDLDPAFSGNGLVILPDGAEPRVAAAADGGSFASRVTTDGWVVMKLRADGAPDASFAGDGAAAVDVRFSNGPEIGVTPGDGIVGAGMRYRDFESSIIVVRLSAAGRRVRSFGTRGVARFDPFADAPHYVTGVVVQPSGRIVVGGFQQYGPRGLDTAPFLLGITPTGELDPAFGDAGMVVTKLARRSAIYGFAMTTAGRIVGVGAVRPGPAAVIARWRVNGSIDRTFGDRGAVRWPESPSASAVAVSPSGDVLAGGLRRIDGMWAGPGIVRLTEDGRVDPSFDGGTVALPGSEFLSVYGLTVQDDGSGLAVTASGGIDNDILVSRVDTEGVLDPAFGVGGVARIERRGHDDPGDAALDGGGDLLVIGRTSPAGPRKVLVARILT